MFAFIFIAPYLLIGFLLCFSASNVRSRHRATIVDSIAPLRKDRVMERPSLDLSVAAAHDMSAQIVLTWAQPSVATSTTKSAEFSVPSLAIVERT